MKDVLAYNHSLRIDSNADGSLMQQIRLKSIFIFAVLAVLLCVDQTALAQRGRATLKQVVDVTVERELKRQQIVGASVGVIIKSRLAYSQGYGFANIEQGTPFTDETVINWASNSKPVMAVMAMQLVQEGKLELDEPVETYLPDLPEHVRAITTRQLLCHQSGIPHYSNGKIVRSETFKKSPDEHDPVIALKRFIESPLIFTPGERREYSSYAYILLTAVVQAAGGEPIAEQLSSRITEPLKLMSFQLDVPFDGQENWSMGYRLRGGKQSVLKDEANFWKHGAGAYKSNVKDFSKFAMALMRPKLINKKTTALMMMPQPTNDGKATTMALGVYVSGKGKSFKFSHNGQQNETRTRMVVFPNRRHGIVVMCNGVHADPGKITTAIYNALSKSGIKY